MLFLYLPTVIYAYVSEKSLGFSKMKFFAVILSLIFSYFFPFSLTKRAFIFGKKENLIQEGFSSAVLENVPSQSLPSKFTICSSHRQEQFNSENTHSIFVIYQDQQRTKHWLSYGFWTNGKFWLNVKKDFWYSSKDMWVENEVFLDWIHICVGIDTENNKYVASINNRTFEPSESITSMTPAPKLYMSWCC